MTNWFINNGYRISDADPCLMISNQGDLAFAWVDDLILVGENTDELISKLNKDFKIKDLGIAQHILGMKINYLEDNKIFLNQEHYVKNLVEEYGLEDGKTTGTPMQANIKLIKATQEESAQFKEKGLDYRSAIGSLNYLSQCTRPDITYVVGKLLQFLENPNDSHWMAFKRVVRYLKGTQDWGILYHADGGHEVTGYVDSSWAEDENSLSTSGYNFNCGSGLISWRSKKLGSPSSSSTEAEYRAYLSASQEAQWLRKLTFDIHRNVPDKTKILSDNQGAIQLAKNPVFHSRTKHIGVHYNFTKDLVVNKEIEIDYIPTELMVADIFTKALDREKHSRFSSMMGLLPLSMIESRARGCVEQVSSANLCMLTTQSRESVTQDMSQEICNMKTCNLDIDNNRLHEVQALEHKDHARKAFSSRLKQKKKQKEIKEKHKSIKEQERLIDSNARALEDMVKLSIVINPRKRKARTIACLIRKRRNITISKYRVKRLESTSKTSILKCFDRRGGRYGRSHTHQWWATV